MFNQVHSVQECDARNASYRFEDGYQNLTPSIPSIPSILQCLFLITTIFLTLQSVSQTH